MDVVRWDFSVSQSMEYVSVPSEDAEHTHGSVGMNGIRFFSLIFGFSIYFDGNAQKPCVFFRPMLCFCNMQVLRALKRVCE